MSTIAIADALASFVPEELPVHITAYDGSSAGPPDAPFTMDLRTERGLSYLLTAPGDLGVARAYVMGDLVATGFNPGDPYPLMSAMRNQKRWRMPGPTEALEGQLDPESTVWECPADRITRSLPAGLASVVPEAMSYHEREGTSYLYNAFFNAFSGGERWQQALGKNREHRPPSTLRLFHDFEPFHNAAGEPGAANYLYADFHVGDLEEGDGTIIIFKKSN